MKRLFLILILTVSAYGAFAQGCGYSSSSIHEYYDTWYKNTCSELLSNAKRGRHVYDSIVRIPVVFHVIYPLYNEVTYDDVVWMLNELNSDFRRRNADTVNMRDIFKGRVSDTRIEFYFADRDPQGRKCSGVEMRVNNTLFGFKPSIPYNQWHSMKFDSLKGFDAWDTRHYLNIWVCNLFANDGRQYLSGFSTSPPGASNWNKNFWGDSLTDGVVIHFGNFRGRYYSSTTTHEVGHYLGLRHVFGDPQTVIADSCLYDDGIFDTPQINGPNYYNCDYGINSCIEKIDDYPDMVENFMDYSSDECRNSFTRGQIDLMHACLRDLRPELAVFSINSTYLDTLYAFVVSPNPNNGHFLIRNDNDEVFQAELYDFNGKLIASMAVKKGINELDMHLSTGNYYLLINNPDQVRVHTQNIVIVN